MSNANCWQASLSASPYLSGSARSARARYGDLPTFIRSFGSFFGWSQRYSYTDSPSCGAVLDASSQRADTYLDLISKIAEYTDLPDDWDGYGGKAADIETFLDACDFIKRLPSTFPPPKPMIGGSGVIGLYWEGNGCYASVELDGSGSYSYIADTPEDETGEDAVLARSPLPQRLAETIVATADLS